jgi:hypothetical protein
VSRPFGEENRARLLGEYFDAQPEFELEPAQAWEHVYRLLLWVDRTTGLAHCYESDKSQPGRPWYARSLAFHDWISNALDVAPDELGDHIDMLFRWVTADLATAAAAARAARASAAAAQREPYRGRSLPEPGQDPELEAIIVDSLADHLASEPPAEVLRALTERIQLHVGQENKRKNLVGEGFEDTLAAMLSRMPSVAEASEVRVRALLHALINRSSGHRTLVSCKWSVRSDREEQFASDFRDYAELEQAGEDFGYVLVTNEFDPARLAAACEMRRQNAPLFTDVVHVNPDGPLAAFAAPARAARNQDRGGIARARQHIESGRLKSLTTWCQQLSNP